MANLPVTRESYLGLAIGQLWLTLVSTFFASIIWVVGKNSLQVFLLILGVVLVGLALLSADITLLRSVRKLPGSSAPENTARGKTLRRRFGLVVAAEIVVIGTVNILLAATNHAVWITPVTFFIVGLHFLPLSFVFNVRPYFVTGLVWIAVVLFTVALVPSTTIVGQGISAWVVLPLVGCALATWATVAYILVAHTGRLRSVQRLGI